MSAQAKGEPAAIVPATIQMPKAMIPTEIRNENAASMMTSHSNIRKNRQRIPPAVRVGDRACISRVVTVCPDALQKGSTWCSLIVTGAGQASEATLENAAMHASGAPF
jgi:hypothetical protein